MSASASCSWCQQPRALVAALGAGAAAAALLWRTRVGRTAATLATPAAAAAAVDAEADRSGEREPTAPLERGLSCDLEYKWGASAASAEVGSFKRPMEYELPVSWACSRKVSIEFDPGSVDAAVRGLPAGRRELLQSFTWRRVFVDNEWVLSPSLTTQEIEVVNAVHERLRASASSPRVSFANDTPLFQRQSFELPADGCHRTKIHRFRWRRLPVQLGDGSALPYFLCVPSLPPDEVSAIRTALKAVLAPPQSRVMRELVEDTSFLRDLIGTPRTKDGPSRAKSASRSLRRALLMTQLSPGSRYRCDQSA